MVIQRSSLNEAIKRRIKEHEKELDKKCNKIWSFTNHLNEVFLFGRLVNKVDKTIVTLAVQNPYVCGGWEPQWD